MALDKTPTPSAGTFLAEGRSVPYVARRNLRARRVWIRVGTDGSLAVVFPRWGHLADAPGLLERNRKWVERALRRHRAARAAAPPPFGHGPTVLYRGRTLPLTVEAAPRRLVLFSRSGFVVQVPPAAEMTRVERQGTNPEGEASGRQLRLPFALAIRPSSLVPRPSAADSREGAAATALAAWYRARAKVVLARRVAHLARRLEFSPGRITVRDTSSRWGSCSPKGALSFSWRILMAPPAILDYLVIHELCHLRHPDHSPRFWAHVAHHCPDFQSHRAWLRRHTFLLPG